MRVTLEEGDLRLDVPTHVHATRFDESYGVSHCGMKAVDFILDLPDRTLYLEFKDPNDPAAPPAEADYLNHALMMDLAKKLRDSFLVQWARGNIGKPIHYYVIVGMRSLNGAQLGAATSSLRRMLPVQGTAPKDWQRFYVSDGAVFDIKSWNRQFPAYRLSRLSEAENA